MNVLAKYDQYDSEDYLCFKLKPSPGGDYVCAFCGKNCDKLVHDNHCVACDNDMEA